MDELIQMDCTSRWAAVLLLLMKGNQWPAMSVVPKKSGHGLIANRGMKR